MELVACHCNWDIPGVDALPPHHHGWSPNDTTREETRSLYGRPTIVLVTVQDPEKEPSMWVDWKSVARELARG